MKSRSLHKKSEIGFTLIELLVVVSVIGMISSITMVSLNSARTKSKIARIAQDLRAIRTAADLYVADNGRMPPRDTPNTTSDTCEQTHWGAYIGKWPLTPWGTHYNYRANSIWYAYEVDVDGITFEHAQMLDKYIDDGNTSTGGLVYGIVSPDDPPVLAYGAFDNGAPPGPGTCN